MLGSVRTATDAVASVKGLHMIRRVSTVRDVCLRAHFTESGRAVPAPDDVTRLACSDHAPVHAYAVALLKPVTSRASDCPTYGSCQGALGAMVDGDPDTEAAVTKVSLFSSQYFGIDLLGTYQGTKMIRAIISKCKATRDR